MKSGPTGHTNACVCVYMYRNGENVWRGEGDCAVLDTSRALLGIFRGWNLFDEIS